MSDIIETELGQIIKLGNGKIKPTQEGNIPIYGGNGVLGYCSKSNYTGNVIIIGRVGAYCGSVYYSKNPVWVSDNALAANPKDDNNSKYLYYLLKQLNLNNYAEGSSHPLVTQGLINAIEVKYHKNPEEQQAIAEVLSSLDDKIDLLHRNNKTLEEMAETLFRQWFVEGAKEEWEEKKVRDISKISSGKSLNRSLFTESGNYPVMGANGEIGRSNEWLLDKKILFTGRVGTLGKIFRVYQKKVWLSDNTLIIQPKDDFYYYLYFFLKKYQLEDLDVGSTQPLLRQSDLQDIDIPIFIDEGKHGKFESLSEVFFTKIEQNDLAIRNLSLLRDTILPKLMSGQIRVKTDK